MLYLAVDSLTIKKEVHIMWDPYADFKKIILPNGLTVFVLQAEREFELFGFVIHAGAREDILEKEGTAHFLEHCVSDNVPDWPNEKIKAHFNEQGGFANLGGTNYLSTTYMCKCLADPEKVSTALDIFGKMLIQAKISTDIEVERKIIMQEYHSIFPFEKTVELTLLKQSQLFPNHRLAKYLRATGDADGIREISMENLQRFYDRFYAPANMSIVAVGKFSPEAIAEFLINSPFGQEKSGERNVIPSPKLPDYSRITRHDIKASMIFGKDSVVAHGSYESYAVLPGKFNVQKIILASNLLEKRLFKIIREEKGWAYSIDVDHLDLQDFFEFYVKIPLKIEALSQAEEVIDRCIATALDDKNFFQEIKQSFVNGLLIQDESYRKICRSSMDEAGTWGKIFSLEEIIRARRSITAEEIKEVLSYLTPDKRLTIIIRP